jgi:hypothetical protein
VGAGCETLVQKFSVIIELFVGGDTAIIAADTPTAACQLTEEGRVEEREKGAVSEAVPIRETSERRCMIPAKWARWGGSVLWALPTNMRKWTGAEVE